MGSLRDAVLSGCGPGGDGASGSGNSNPLGKLADSLLGGKGKTQERARELPGLQSRRHQLPPGMVRGSDANTAGLNVGGPRSIDSESIASFLEDDRYLLREKTRLPGASSSSQPLSYGDMNDIFTNLSLERPNAMAMSNSQRNANEMAAAWTAAVESPDLQRHLHTFLQSLVAKEDFRSVAGGLRPGLEPSTAQQMLSPHQRACIRNRTSILGRQLLAEQGSSFADEQVSALLVSLGIGELGRQPEQRLAPEALSHRLARFDAVYEEVSRRGDSLPAQQASERQQVFEGAWKEPHVKAEEAGTSSWASEFHNRALGEGEVATEQLENTATGETLQQLDSTRQLMHTMESESDPRFRQSKFLQFISKMSRGELELDGNTVKERSSMVSQSWANEFPTEGNQTSTGWAEQFGGAMGDIDAGEVWAEQYEEDFGSSAWAEEYFRQQSANALQSQSQETDKSDYQFVTNNPYVTHENPMEKGLELFRNGVLSEALLAFEAAAQQDPQNAHAWRMLGTVHAENDDDGKAIAAMLRALRADGKDLEVLLSLGVSHTNEFAQAEATMYLLTWLKNNPKYNVAITNIPATGDVAPAAAVALFTRAAELHPEDADVHAVLGVLYNLTRDYDKAIQSFRSALKARPQDYSLWNKLGATQANSARSEEAVEAYQSALELKPNYVRAWSNMGIAFSNQGIYDESVKYYVRALTLNPAAESVWQYLRISVISSSRMDLLDAVDRKDLATLSKAFPL